jgi:DNA polymerase-3 subunit alpha
MLQELISYLKSNHIAFAQVGTYQVRIGEELYSLVEPDEEGKLFDEGFNILAEEDNGHSFIFCFGGKWYWSPQGGEVQLNPLKYLGKATERGFSFLGIHGGYELLNGSRLYEDWCKKAKFLQISTLGICERDSLSGLFQFQSACKASGIKPIIGGSFTVWRKSADLRYPVKCYVRNEEGWYNLLQINRHVNVVNNKFIGEADFLSYTEGLFVVFDPKYLDFDKIFPLDLNRTVYFQLDTVNFSDVKYNEWYFNNLQKYLKKSRTYSEFQPVLIQDAYYLDKEDSYIKPILNSISGKVTERLSVNQYMKTFGEVIEEFSEYFDEDTVVIEQELLTQATANLSLIVKGCDFQIKAHNQYLPEYKMNDSQKLIYESNEDMLWALCLEGLQRKIPKKDWRIYLERFKYEFSIVQKGGFIDYFLILWDIIQWAHSQNILTGIGRGSAAGSAMAFFLNITQVDPIKFNLLFERFLNEGRMAGHLPDVDSDFPGEQRDNIKHYMEQRFGELQVCSVGTYTTLQLKALMKDLARQKGLDIGEMNYITKVLDVEDGSLLDIFHTACKNSRFKSFVSQNADLINTLNLALHQPKSESIHPCATIIVPQAKDIFSWMPVKTMMLKDGSSMLVSEWEGTDLEEVGFLKEDILGIAQLDKFTEILSSIKEHNGDVVDIYTLPLEDQEVYKYFQKGWNGDVFHFGSLGLTGYCRMLKPGNIEDLIAGIALFRPGSMESGFHNEYVLLKEGKREISYDWGTENATKDTFGLIIYQEQVMQICADIGDFSLVESDDVRRALGKKKIDVLLSYKEKFLSKAKEKGCPYLEAEEIWGKLEKFTKYSFNRSHAAAYALTGYVCQWLKIHYPLHFWNSALKFGKDEKLAGYISEINKTGQIRILPPDINNSQSETYSDFTTNTIFWSLTSIKQCGDKAMEQLDEDKKQNGAYYSFSEFYERNKFIGSKVNKRTIENLILCGAFDSLIEIKDPRYRKRLFDQFYEIIKHTKKDEDWVTIDDDRLKSTWWWTLQQRRLCGLGFFDYRLLLTQNKFTDIIVGDLFFEPESVTTSNSVGGYVMSVEEKKSKKGMFGRLILDSNYDMYPVTVWPTEWEKFSDQLLESKDKLLLINGTIVYDSFSKQNVLSTTNNSRIIIMD